jgi:hypothetical protein
VPGHPWGVEDLHQPSREPTQQLQPLTLHLVAVGVVVWYADKGVVLFDQCQQLLPQGVVHRPSTT